MPLTGLARRAVFQAFMLAKALVSPVAFGAAGAVFDAEGRVLLVRHSYMDGWRLPGGGVARGERAADGALRELREEVGLTGGRADFFGLYTARAGLATNVIALYRVSGGNIAFKPNWEVRQICFADPAAPPEGTTAATILRLKELTGALPKVEHWQP